VAEVSTERHYMLGDRIAIMATLLQRADCEGVPLIPLAELAP
jgi:hypothetical protein